jgi:membrane protease YdiL (CAAX protease family)
MEEEEMTAQLLPAHAGRVHPTELTRTHLLGPVGIVRRFPLVSFFVLACVFGWSPFALTYLSGGSGAENFPLAPLFATLVVVSCQGRGELKAFGRRLRSWGAAPRWYLLAVLAPIAVTTLIVAINHGLGAPLPTSAQLAGWPQVLVTFVTMLIFVGIGEESGWTAFAGSVLLRRHGVLLAVALASAMRIFWHLPMMISGDLPWVLGTVGNAAFTVLMLLLLMACDGRWTLVAVWHAALNATGGLFVFKMVEGPDNVRLDYLLAAVYTVLAVSAYLAGGRHLTLREHTRAAEMSSHHE